MIETATEPSLQAERLALRPMARADAARVSALAGDVGVARMTASIPHPYGLADAEAFIDRVLGGHRPNAATFALDLPAEGLIGMLAFRPGDALGPEVGYWLGRPYWGAGYATEALKRALGWASRDWGARCVGAGHFVDNPASGAALGKAGFLYTGRTELKSCLARGESVLSRRLIWLA